MFGPNSLNVARYAAFIWAKSPTKWSAQLPESNFQTHSRQNFDGDVGASTRNFNDAMVRNRQFTTTITV
ncbi:DUF6783 domain-containing protein [Lachnospiraceae bacterium 45-P1]